jgi:hypothetical protein
VTSTRAQRLPSQTPPPPIEALQTKPDPLTLTHTSSPFLHQHILLLQKPSSPDRHNPEGDKEIKREKERTGQREGGSGPAGRTGAAEGEPRGEGNRRGLGDEGEREGGGEIRV